MDPCHLYDKPAVDCILSDWEEWGECDVSRGALLRCGFNLFFFSYVSMFNLFKLQLTPSSVRCGAGQQVKRRQVVQCPSNGPTEAETAWKSHLTVFGFHHPSLALHVEIIATEVSKQRWLWLYFCLVGASCGKPCDKY